MQATAFAFLFASPALVSLVAAVTLLALSQMFYGPLVQTVVSEFAPTNAQATYQAAFSVASDLRDAAGPAIGTWLFAIAAGIAVGERRRHLVGRGARSCRRRTPA